MRLAAAFIGFAIAGVFLTPVAIHAQAPVAAEEEVAKIEGIEVARPDGRWLGLEVVGPTFRLSFYDADKKPESPDVARATARWDPINKTGNMRTVLNPAGNSLVSPAVVRPPLLFKVYFTLLSAEGTVVEQQVIDLRSMPKEPVVPTP